MAWRSVTIEPKKSVYVAEMNRPEVGKLDLSGALNSHTERNFRIELTGGVLTTHKGPMSNNFRIVAKLGDETKEALIRDLLVSQWGNEKLRVSHMQQGLTIVAAAREKGKRKEYGVRVVSAEWMEDRPRNPESRAFKLAPVVPKEFLKGLNGVKVNGTDTREGIDPKLNDRALVWARTLRDEFGLSFSKLNARCVKSVCIEPRRLDSDEIVEMLRRGNRRMELEMGIKGYGSDAFRQYVTVELTGGSLVVEGNAMEAKRYWAGNLTGRTEEIMNSAGLLVDKRKHIAFDDHYYTVASIKVREWWTGIKERVGGYVSRLDRESQEELRQRNERIKARLQETGVLDRQTTTFDNPVCIVQYDPECLLAAKPDQQAVKESVTGSGGDPAKTLDKTL